MFHIKRREEEKAQKERKRMRTALKRGISALAATAVLLVVGSMLILGKKI
jgi:hypothetical protein